MEDKTALLVIDAQAGMFMDDDNLPYRSNETLAAIRSLIDRARASETPVIFVRHMHTDYEPMKPGNPGFEIRPEIAPAAGETIIDKAACDAFCETPLAALLEHLDVSRVVIAGMQTEYCIDTACRSALHRGYDVVLAEDGHSTWDNGAISAEQIIAHHNQTLGQLPRPNFGITVTPAADIEFVPAEQRAEAASAV